MVEVRSGEVLPADARARLTSQTWRSTNPHSPVKASPSQSKWMQRPVPLWPSAPAWCSPAPPWSQASAVGVVTAVGSRTQLRRATEVPRCGARTPVGVQARLRDLTDRTWPVSIAGGGLVTGLGLLRFNGLRQAIASGVAVTVAAVPEGLPLVATLAQQASARRLTRLGALVRTPRSVEALGRVDVVCFDKTGTLSQNRLRVTAGVRSSRLRQGGCARARRARYAAAG